MDGLFDTVKSLSEHVRQRVSDIRILIDLNDARIGPQGVQDGLALLQRVEDARVKATSAKEKSTLKELADRVEAVADLINRSIAPQGPKAGFAGIGENMSQQMHGWFSNMFDAVLRVSDRVFEQAKELRGRLNVQRARFTPTAWQGFMDEINRVDRDRLRIKVAYERKDLAYDTADTYLRRLGGNLDVIGATIDAIIRGENPSPPAPIPELPPLPGESQQQVYTPTQTDAPQQTIQQQVVAPDGSIVTVEVPISGPPAPPAQKGVSKGMMIGIGLGAAALIAILVLRKRKQE